MSDVEQTSVHPDDREPPPSCHYCGRHDREMRPYGPGGSTVCFPCAMETPEREAETEARFIGTVETAAIFGGGVVLLTNDGVIPGDPSMLDGLL